MPSESHRGRVGHTLWHDLRVTDDKHDVIAALRRLMYECDAGEPERWENVTIPAYLEAMAAWLEGYEQVYLNTGRTVPTEGTWFL